jgi:hypothetical protein
MGSGIQLPSGELDRETSVTVRDRHRDRHRRDSLPSPTIVNVQQQMTRVDS